MPAIANGDKRYVWINVPYVFIEPAKYIAETEECTDTKRHEWEKGISEEYRKETCTFHPERYIPEQRTEKRLRVHVDCKDKTYDAKGDKKGWRSISLQDNVIKSSIVPCTRNGYDMSELISQINYSLENQTLSNKKLIDNNQSSYQSCIEQSLEMIDRESESEEENRKLKFLSEGQRYAYFLRIKSKIPSGCKKITNLSNSHLIKSEIGLTVWDPIREEALQYVLNALPFSN